MSVQTLRFPSLVWKWAPLVRSGVLASLFLFLFYSTLKGMVFDWWSYSPYSHGFLIPLISGYLLWCRRKDLRECPRRPSLGGLGIFLLGLGFFMLGWSGEEEFIQRLSLPATLIGLIYFLAGKQMARLCLFPVGYLLLMIPIPFALYKTAALDLRLLDAKLATASVSFLGIPIFREGYLLHLPEIKLEVADACSGFLSIVTMLAIGILYLYQLQTKWKSLLWVSMIPIAVLTNVVRIVLIVVLTYFFGEWALSSTFHRMSGTFNFLLGFMTLVILGNGLNRISLRKETRR